MTVPYAGLFLRGVEQPATSLGVDERRTPCRNDAQIEGMMAHLAFQGRGGLPVLPDAFTTLHRDAIVALAARYHLPAVYPYRLFAVVGGLMSYGIDQADVNRRAATYIGRIFKGTKPGDLPVKTRRSSNWW